VALNEEIKFNGVLSHLDAAVSNVLSAVKYERLEHHGPKHLKVSREDPLVTK
jgi:hypothetical protein